MPMDTVFDQVEKNMERLVASQIDWTQCATPEQLTEAREGRLSLGFYGKEIPSQWFGEVQGRNVLCLAGAGGFQGPLLACAGAKVTVLDLSEGMLAKDREIARRENLSMQLVKGNMCELSRFEAGQFDLILNPPSLMYVPNPRAVFRECAWVLRKGGTLIVAAPCPVNYLCDYVSDENGGYYKAVHRMPYDARQHDDSGWIEYGHTMETYLGGLMESGFSIHGYLECQMEDITELYFCVRAVRN